MNNHKPVRPSWDCVECGQPYPCPEALERMAASADPWATSTYLARLFVTAVNDLPHIPVMDLYDRFLLRDPARRPRPDR